MTEYPHDEYVAAVTGALADVGLDPATITRDDSDTRGSYCYLRAMFRFTPETTHGMAETDWPHGLLLIWEWHTGIEADQGEPERGPVWLWAKCLRDGVNEEPARMPIPGIANPMQVAWTLAELINSGQAKKRRIGEWDGAAYLTTACEAWAAEEAS